jgi:outer membrane immunogenic protein
MMSVAGLTAAVPAFAQAEAPWWSGWYLGANVGATWGHPSLDRTISPGSGPVVIPPADLRLINTGTSQHSGAGVTGGIEGGYDYNMGGWLLGLEMDFAGLDHGKQRFTGYTSPINPARGYTVGSAANVDWMFTFRPRLGYTEGPWLLYITGGLAVGNGNVDAFINDNRTPQNRVSASRSGTEEGWVAGGGLGYALTDALSMKVEYLYADFGSRTETVVRPLATLSVRGAARPQIGRVGLDYHFGGPVHEEAPAYVPPPPAPPAAPTKYMVFFDFNKSDLTPEGRTIVDQAAANAGPAHATSITVTGHTDTVGSDAYNMRLSRRRAESVAAELEAKGVPSSGITLVAKGKRDLLVPTADGVREPQNRRVEIVYGGAPAS